MVLGQIFGGLNHPRNHAKAFNRLAHHASARQPVMQGQIARPNPFADVGGVMFNIGHAFTSACDHHVAHPGLDHHRGIHDRLKPGAAPTVDLVTGHFNRQASGQP